MIVGSGDIASVLVDREDRLYFASGVSNSQETRESEFQREADLLLKQDRTKHIVYFSSLSVFYADTRYTQHKRKMEELVKSFPHYTILRLGNIIWGSNPHTFINHIRSKIKNAEQVEIRDVYRYVIEKEEFLHWISLVPNWNCEISIGKMMKVKEVVDRYIYSKLDKNKY